MEDRPWSLLSKDSEIVMGDSKCFHPLQKIRANRDLRIREHAYPERWLHQVIKRRKFGRSGPTGCVSQGSNVVHRSEVTKAGSEARVGIFDDAHRVEQIDAASGRFSVGSLTRMPNRNN